MACICEPLRTGENGHVRCNFQVSIGKTTLESDHVLGWIAFMIPKSVESESWTQWKIDQLCSSVC